MSQPPSGLKSCHMQDQFNPGPLPGFSSSDFRGLLLGSVCQRASPEPAGGGAAVRVARPQRGCASAAGREGNPPRLGVGCQSSMLEGLNPGQRCSRCPLDQGREMLLKTPNDPAPDQSATCWLLSRALIGGPVCPSEKPLLSVALHQQPSTRNNPNT